MPIAIVSRTLIVVRQNFVGFFRLLKFFFGFFAIRIAIRMVFHRQLAVGFFQLIIRGVFSNTKDFIKVTFCHDLRLLKSNRMKYILREIYLSKSPGRIESKARQSLLIALDFFELSIDDVIIGRLGTSLCTCATLCCSLSSLSLGIHLFTEFL